MLICIGIAGIGLRYRVMSVGMPACIRRTAVFESREAGAILKRAWYTNTCSHPRGRRVEAILLDTYGSWSIRS